MQIDWWTLALQTVNVLVLIWILSRFFLRPVADIVAKRQQAAEKLLADAARDREAAATDKATTAEAQAAIATERDQVLKQAQVAAAAARAAELAAAKAEITKLRAAAAAEIGRDGEAAEKAIVDHASALSIDIARRLLDRLPQDAGLDAFVDGLASQLHDMPDSKRKALAGDDEPIIVFTATALAKEQSDRVASRIDAALGRTSKLEFHVDGSLVAGIELQGRTIAIRNSWRANLEQIRQELESGGADRKP